MVEDCIFCKIVEGSIPSSKIYEDDSFIVIMDINPESKGHALLIPKKHHENLLEEDPSSGNTFLRVIQLVSKAMKNSLGAKAINVVSNIGREAGQEVMHTHIHLIPKYDGDKTHYWSPIKVSDEDMILLAEKLIKELAILLE